MIYKSLAGIFLTTFAACEETQKEQFFETSILELEWHEVNKRFSGSVYVGSNLIQNKVIFDTTASWTGILKEDKSNDIQ